MSSHSQRHFVEMNSFSVHFYWIFSHQASHIATVFFSPSAVDDNQIVCNSEQKIVIFAPYFFVLLPFVFVILSDWFENGVIYRHIYNLIPREKKN